MRHGLDPRHSQRAVLDLVFHELTPITGVGEIQVEHLLGEGLSPNLNFHRILKILGKVYLDANASLWASIKKFLRLLGNNFAKGFGNGLNERLAW